MLGVGYLIGIETSLVLLAGGVVGWMMLIPVLRLARDQQRSTSLAHWLAVTPAASVRTTPGGHYVRFVGAGQASPSAASYRSARRSPASAGPSRSGIRGFRRESPLTLTLSPGGGSSASAPTATSAALSSPSGSSAVALGLWLIPPFELGAPRGFSWPLIFSFFFVVVASRLVGPDQQHLAAGLGHDHRGAAQLVLHHLARARHRPGADVCGHDRRNGGVQVGDLPHDRPLAGSQDLHPRRRHTLGGAERPDRSRTLSAALTAPASCCSCSTRATTWAAPPCPLPRRR